jgi:hypothetical protein
MEKILLKVSYWLGVVCIVLAILSKALNAVGVNAMLNTRGNDIGYHTFIIGTVIFFLMAIATASLDSFNKNNKQNP